MLLVSTYTTIRIEAPQYEYSLIPLQASSMLGRETYRIQLVPYLVVDGYPQWLALYGTYIVHDV